MRLSKAERILQVLYRSKIGAMRPGALPPAGRPSSVTKIHLLSALLILIFSGCQAVQVASPRASATRIVETSPAAQPISTPSTPSSPTGPAATAGSNPSITPGTTSTPHRTEAVHERTQYRIQAVLDYDRHSVQVREAISYTNPAGKDLEELLLVVEAAFYPGVFQLDQVALRDGSPITGWNLDGTFLYVPLPAPLASGKRSELQLSYQLQLPSPQPSPTTRPVPFGYTARQTNLVDWYPYLPPWQDGWLAHRPGYFGEHQVYETSDFEVRVKLANPGRAVMLAASAPAEVDGEWQSYHLEAGRTFALSASDQFQVLSETVGTTTLWSYFFPLHKAAGEQALHTAAQALDLYNQTFGPYPHDHLAVVEADFLDGMEYEGLVFLSYGFYNTYEGGDANYLSAIAAHETAHQWFYGVVGNDQALEPWLDEALSTYCERLYYERYDPQALDAWWWPYRVDYYEPQGPVGGGIYDFGGYPQPYRSYRDAIYLNGAKFLEALRQEIGDEAFFAFLKDYVQQSRGKIVSGEDFFRLLQNYTGGEDLQPLIERFFKE